MSELTAQPEHVSTHSSREENLKFGMWLYLASEVIIFGILIATYAVFRFNNPAAVRTVQHGMSVGLVGLNTFILLASSYAMVKGLLAIRQGNAEGLVRWIGATALLGVLFLGGQAIEYKQLENEGITLYIPGAPPEEDQAGPVSAGGAIGGGTAEATEEATAESTEEATAETTAEATEETTQEPTAEATEEPTAEPTATGFGGGAGPSVEGEAGEISGLSTTFRSEFGMRFYVMTSFHGAHVLVGVLWALFVVLNGRRGRYSTSNNIGVEIFGLYWHFVDVVWIFLFTIIYLI